MAAAEMAPRPADPDGDYDGPLLQFGDFMIVLGEHDGVVVEVAEPGTAVRQMVIEIAYDLPMELRVGLDEAGGLSMLAGPTTQRVETTIFPVLHRLKVRLARTGEAYGIDQENGDGGT